MAKPHFLTEMFGFLAAIAAALAPDPEDPVDQQEMLDTLETSFYFHKRPVHKLQTSNKASWGRDPRLAEEDSNDALGEQDFDDAECFNQDVIQLSAERMGRGLKRRQLSDLSWGRSIRSITHLHTSRKADALVLFSDPSLHNCSISHTYIHTAYLSLSFHCARIF